MKNENGKTQKKKSTLKKKKTKLKEDHGAAAQKK